MKIKCEYCRSYISDIDEKCPYCGGTNIHLKRVGNGVPTTIDELKQWYVEHNLPDEKITRFFIGKDFKGLVLLVFFLMTKQAIISYIKTKIQVSVVFDIKEMMKNTLLTNCILN